MLFSRDSRPYRAGKMPEFFFFFPSGKKAGKLAHHMNERSITCFTFYVCVCVERELKELKLLKTEKEEEIRL